MDPRLSPSIFRHDVETRTRWMASDACLTRRPSRPLLSVSAGADAGQQLPAMATLLAVLDLGWPGRQFRFRYPLPEDGPELRRSLARHRRDYRLPYRLGMRQLVTDGDLEQAARDPEPVDERELAFRFGVTVDDMRARHRDYLRQRAPRPNVLDIEEYQARQAPPPASWKKGPKPSFEVCLAEYLARHPADAAGPIPF